MNDTAISLETHRSSVDNLRRLGRVPAIAARAPDVGHWVTADLIVDLQKVYDEARAAKALSIQVFADVVTVPASFDGAIGDGIEILSIVARRMEIEANTGAQLQIKRGEGSDRPLVRLLVGEMSGPFVLIEDGREIGRLTAVQGGESLCFHQLRAGVENVEAARADVPQNWLDPGRPLRDVFAASFSLAAWSTFGKPPLSPELRLAADILRWLIRWSYYPSADLSPMFSDADTLRQLLPVAGSDSKPVLSVPRRTPAQYLEIARAQAEIARQQEMKEGFQQIRDDNRAVAKTVVGVFLKRDAARERVIAEEIKVARQLLASSEAAVAKAARELASLQTDSELAQIELRGELERHQFLATIKAVFKAIYAVVEVATGIAALYAGMPKVPDLKGMMKDLDSMPARFENFKVFVKTIELIPGLVTHQGKDDQSKAAGKIVSGALGFHSALGAIDRASADVAIIKEIGALVSKAAASSDTVEAKARWEMFEKETTNDLQLVLDDDDASSLKPHAMKLKTLLQKLAIQGRAFAEQQALLAQRVRNLGTLLLESSALQENKRDLEQLVRDLDGDNRDAMAHARRVEQVRLDDLRRSFFVTTSAFCAAYVYETLRQPRTVPAVPASANEMLEIVSVMVDDQSTGTGNVSKFTLSKDLDAPDFVAKLKDKGSATFVITPDDPIFDRHSVIRSTQIRATLRGVEPPPRGSITVELETEPSFVDRRITPTHEVFAFTGQPNKIRYRYGQQKSEDELGGARPALFTTWTISCPDVDLAALTGVQLELVGSSKQFD